MLLALALTALELYQQANVLFRQQKFAEAGTTLDAALFQDPKLIPALTLKGKLAMALNRFDTAREALEKAASLAPQDAYVQFLLGFFYYVDNDFLKALPPLEAANRLKPDDVQTLFYLALTQEGLARPELGIPFYEKALSLSASADIHVAYGRLLFSLGQYAKSEQHVASALKLAPDSRDAHYETGRLLFERGQFEQAASEGEQALKLAGTGTTDRQIHYLLARAYGKLGKKELADRHLAKFKASGASLRR